MRRVVFAVVMVLALAVGRMPAHAQVHDPNNGGGETANPDTIAAGDNSGGSQDGGGGVATPWYVAQWSGILSAFRLVLPSGSFLFRGL